MRKCWPYLFLAGAIVFAVVKLGLSGPIVTEVQRLARGPLVTMSNVCSGAMPWSPAYRNPASPGCVCPEPDHPAWIPPRTVHGRIDLRHTDRWECGDSLSAGTGG